MAVLGFVIVMLCLLSFGGMALTAGIVGAVLCRLRKRRTQMPVQLVHKILSGVAMGIGIVSMTVPICFLDLSGI